MADKNRLSLNQITTERWSLQEAIDGCMRFGIPSIALWRNKIADAGLNQTVRLVRDAGVHVSSICRGGMFVSPDSEARKQRIEENFRAIDEAAALNADSLVIVVGAHPAVPIDEGRRIVEDGIAAIVPYAKERGVRIGLEPLHPMFAADRSVINTIGQALAIAEPYPPTDVGIILDVIHIWWDPQLYSLIDRAAPRIMGFHVSDWPAIVPDILKCRCMMGDGVIELRRIREAIDAAGYNGPIEVEILSEEVWNTHGDHVLEQMIERFTSLV
jgi:sugar phosphate isomerase/epimerase